MSAHHVSPFTFPLLLLIASALHGAEFTLADAFQRTTAGHPLLAAQAARERAADARAEQAALRPNPTLDFNAENFLGTGGTRDIRRLELTAQISQTFERAAKREQRLRLAGHERAIAQAELAVLRTEILGATALAYASTILARQRADLAEEALALAQATLNTVENQVGAGTHSSADLARARAAFAIALAGCCRHQADLAAARAALAARWNGHASDFSELPGLRRVPDFLPPERDFLARLENHPRLVLRHMITASEHTGHALAQAQAGGDITASGGVRFVRENSDATFVAGISIPFPMRHRNQGNIRAAREAVTASEHTAQALAAELRAETTTAWQACHHALAIAAGLRRDALPASEEALALVRQAHASGQVSILDVREAQRALHSLRRDILEADAEAVLALVRLETLTNPSFPLFTSLLSQP